MCELGVLPAGFTDFGHELGRPLSLESGQFGYPAHAATLFLSGSVAVWQRPVLDVRLLGTLVRLSTWRSYMPRLRDFG
jgi:hypothetical protein